MRTYQKSEKLLAVRTEALAGIRRWGLTAEDLPNDLSRVRIRGSVHFDEVEVLDVGLLCIGPVCPLKPQNVAERLQGRQERFLVGLRFRNWARSFE